MRGVMAAWTLGVIAALTPALGFADAAPFSVRIVGEPIHGESAEYWLTLELAAPPSPADGIPILIVHAARQTRFSVFAQGSNQPLALATQLPGFRGTQDSLILLPPSGAAGNLFSVHVDTTTSESSKVSFAGGMLGETLGTAAQHDRMIALAFGALLATALAALMMWFVLADRLFVLYASFFFLQALYIVYLSGQGFDWPLLKLARPLTSFAWNVPVSLGGAVGCLFVREIADLRRFSPRVDLTFSVFAVAFVAVTLANIAKLAGYGPLIAAVGNVIFSLAAIFTLAVSYVAWRGGNRAAGWFLLAWGLLEGFAITAAVRFLFTRSASDDNLLYYYGLPLSMVAAAVLIALGVADRLRDQRAALTDAERLAQTDPLTGVLNRRSLLERLESGCARARARGLPIAVLFIDIDHFKTINDSFGHQAGDACLRAIISPIQAELRQSDVIGRYGGEEFVIVLSSADAAAARPIAQRILERVAGVSVDGFGQPLRLTCSIGVAASDTLGVWGEGLIASADAAVYAAKRGGRNQVQIAAPLAA